MPLKKREREREGRKEMKVLELKIKKGKSADLFDFHKSVTICGKCVFNFASADSVKTLANT